MIGCILEKHLSRLGLAINAKKLATVGSQPAGQEQVLSGVRVDSPKGTQLPSKALEDLRAGLRVALSWRSLGSTTYTCWPREASTVNPRVAEPSEPSRYCAAAGTPRPNTSGRLRYWGGAQEGGYLRATRVVHHMPRTGYGSQTGGNMGSAAPHDRDRYFKKSVCWHHGHGVGHPDRWAGSPVDRQFPLAGGRDAVRESSHGNDRRNLHHCLLFGSAMTPMPGTADPARFLEPVKSAEKTLFWLGAGFSRCLNPGAPLMNDFFVGLDAAKYPHLAKYLSGRHGAAVSVNVEDVLFAVDQVECCPLPALAGQN